MMPYVNIPAQKIRRAFGEINGEFDFRPVTVNLVMHTIKSIDWLNIFIFVIADNVQYEISTCKIS